MNNRFQKLIQKYYFIWLFALFFTFSCNDNDDESFAKQYPINTFVWNAMNHWYLWQDQVPNLSDNADYKNLIKSNSDPNRFFNSLLYNYGFTDRFSVIVGDYNLLLDWLSGISTSYGMEYVVVGNNYSFSQDVAVVRYIIPNSPAAQAGIKRGDIITKVDGMTINSSNEYDLFYIRNSATFTFGKFENGILNDNIGTKMLSKTKINENPVHLIKVHNEGNKKIGYLVYNGFTSEYDVQLNQAFGELKTQNVTDLILDLRYNGGGSVQTAQYLAQMITGQFTGQIFAKTEYNRKNSRYNSIDNFVDKMEISKGSFQNINSLKMNHLYVLVSNHTASASELIVNSLKPYIDVVLIGTTTYGKNVGFFPTIDDPSNLYIYTGDNLDKANKLHKVALLPVSFKALNTKNESNYANGFTPDYQIDENEYISSNLSPLGSTSEPLFAKAVDLIAGTNYFTNTRKKSARLKQNFIPIENPSVENTIKNSMYKTPISHE